MESLVALCVEILIGCFFFFFFPGGIRGGLLLIKYISQATIFLLLCSAGVMQKRFWN